MVQFTNLGKDIAGAASRERDVSTRDGNQSKLANRLRQPHILEITKAQDIVSKLIQDAGFEAPPAEKWGGGQVLQPANMLKEDSFHNLAELHQAAPHTKIQCLNRGRQCWAFRPVKPEVIEGGLRAAYDRGLRVVRVFDMMNDIRNLDATFEAVRKINEGRPEHDRLQLEGAISYNSEPREGTRAWTFKEYAAYAVRLAKKGADEIVIKNYAGTGTYEIVGLVEHVRVALDEAGYKDKRLNLHMHGAHTKLMADALDKGAHKVDVATGELAGGPSFTDAVELIKEQLSRKGYDIESSDFKKAFEADPIITQLRKVEQVIHDELAIQQKEAPIPMAREFSEEEIEKYRMAAGALSDVWTRIAGICRPSEGGKKMLKIGKVALEGEDELHLLYERVLERAAELWELGGRFNTVTPGAKIAADQALALTMVELQGSLEPNKKLPAYKPLSEFQMSHFIPAYMDIVTSRFGHNQGLEDKGIGDAKLRDSFLMIRALDRLNKGFTADKISIDDLRMIANAASIGEKGTRLTLSGKGFELKHPDLQQILRNADIAKFRMAVNTHIKDKEFKDQVIYELTAGRSPDPTDGIAEGQEIVSKVPYNLADLHKSGAPISHPDIMPVMAMIMRGPGKNGEAHDDSVFNNLVASIAKKQAEKPHADTLGPRSGFAASVGTAGG